MNNKLLLKRTFITRLAHIKIILGVGQGWFYELKGAVLIGASIKVLLNLNIFEAILLTIIAMIGFYLVGLFDVKKLRAYQKIQELQTTDYNPNLNRIKKL